MENMSTEAFVARDDIPTGGKNPGLAMVLSLLCVGAGQFYNGEQAKAAMMFLAAAFSGIFFGVGAFVVVIPLIAYGMIDANKVAKEINLRLRAAANQAQQAEKEKIVLDQTTVSAQSLVAQIDKLRQLASSGLLTETEFSERKAQVLSVLDTRKPREPVEDFLTALIPLIRSEALSTDEVTRIKSLVLGSL